MKLFGFYITRQDFGSLYLDTCSSLSRATEEYQKAKRERDKAIAQMEAARETYERELENKQKTIINLSSTLEELERKGIVLSEACDKLIDENTEYSARIDELEKQLNK